MIITNSSNREHLLIKALVEVIVQRFKSRIFKAAFGTFVRLWALHVACVRIGCLSVQLKSVQFALEQADLLGHCVLLAGQILSRFSFRLKVRLVQFKLEISRKKN